MAKKKGSAGKILLASAAAAAGTYFLLGKDGRKNRKKVGKWAQMAKAEALKRLEKMNIVDEKKYNAAVDKVAAKYKTLKDVDSKEVEGIVRDLRKHWKNMMKAPAKKASPKKKKRV